MHTKTFSLSRRTVLRGAAAAGASVVIPLPRLAGMLNNNGTAYADGTPLPKRFGVWFSGNGTLLERYIPAATGSGAAWKLSEFLQPLSAVKSYLSVVTGLTMSYPANTQNSMHHHGSANNLTGAQLVLAPGGAREIPQLPSIDQVIASAPGFQGSATFRSLELGVTQGVGGSFKDTILGAISRTGPDATNFAEISPRAIFTRLFGGSGTSSIALGATAEVKANEAAARHSAVDLITLLKLVYRF